MTSCCGSAKFPVHQLNLKTQHKVCRTVGAYGIEFYRQYFIKPAIDNIRRLLIKIVYGLCVLMYKNMLSKMAPFSFYC